MNIFSNFAADLDSYKEKMLRIAVQSKGRLFDDTMNLLAEADIKAYLDERRLVTVKVNVERPQYTELSVYLEIIRKSTGASERLKRDITKALRKFLHPIVGGRDGKGWKFGRSVLKVDLFHIVENVDGVEFVDYLQILDEDRNIFVDQIKLGPKGLPYLVNVEITEKTRERVH